LKEGEKSWKKKSPHRLEKEGESGSLPDRNSEDPRKKQIIPALRRKITPLISVHQWKRKFLTDNPKGRAVGRFASSE